MCKEVDALIVIPNDRLLEISDRTIGIIEAFKTADTALLAGVQGITDLITMNSYIHVDFSDVTAVLRGAGTALFGIGAAKGEDRATQAAEIAISSPLLEESIEGAHGALINIAGPSDLKLQEASAATELVRKAIHPEAQIIWGLSLDDSYGDEVRVTVIAAGFDAHPKAEESSAKAGQFVDMQADVKPVAPAQSTSSFKEEAQAALQVEQPASMPSMFEPAMNQQYSPSAAPVQQTAEPDELDIPDFLR